MADCKWLKEQWVERMTDALCLRNPEMDRKQIRKTVEEEYEKWYKDHAVKIHNSYENTVYHTTLGQTVDWIQSFKPLIAESGVFFYPKHMKRNLNVEIIKEAMLDARTVHKKEKFAAIEAGDMFTARTKDLQQGNDKKAANSGYGAEGQSSSFLFNLNSAMSVTASGRGQLSTAIQTIENFLADNVKFFSMDEFYQHISNIIHEKDEWKYDTLKSVEDIPNKSKWVSRFERKFLHPNFCDQDALKKVYDGLSDELRIRTYYKCNLIEFLRNMKPKMKLQKMLTTPIEFKKKQKINQFVDPNEVPDSWKDQMSEFTQLILEFVGYRYGQFRYEDRTKYQKRAVVPVSDTDSCFITMGRVAQTIKESILPMRLYRKGDIDKRKYYNLAVINVLSSLCSSMIRQTLDHYLDKVHVAKEDQKYINMKNEFHYRRLIVTYAKKSYIGLLLRQESHVFEKPKLDVKGISFFKSTASKQTSAFIYDHILVKRLLDPPGGHISLQDTYREIAHFQSDISNEIQNGNIGFMKPVKVKSPDAYANPMRIGAYKAAYVWNYIVGEAGPRITFPTIGTQVKVSLRNKQDAAKLEPWPDIYRKVIELFDQEPEIGDVLTYDTKTGKEKVVKGKGIKSIMLPEDMEEIPEWVLAIINTETIVNDNMQLFAQLMRPLGLSRGESSKNGTATKYYTNIVRI